MATIYNWNPFGVALDITATPAHVVRTSETQYTVTINVSWETYYSGAKTNYGMTASSGGQTVTLNNFGTSSGSGKASFTGTYSIEKNVAATKTITVAFRNFNDDTKDSATKNVTFNVNVKAWTHYEVRYHVSSALDASKVSGLPSTQTKWHGQKLTLSSAKPTMPGHYFTGWDTKAAASGNKYRAGGTYNTDAHLDLYTVFSADSHRVYYDLNYPGSEDSPIYLKTQDKIYTWPLQLHDTIPTRDHYQFLGWGTSPTAITPVYQPGDYYTAEADLKLYAIWKYTYEKPRITDLTVARCTLDGTLTDEGLYAKVSFGWATDETVSSVTIERKSAEDTTWASTKPTASGTSGTQSVVIGSGALALNKSYTIRVTVTDSLGSNTASKTLPTQFFTFDFNEGGTAAALGGEADIDNTFKNNFDLMQVGNKYCYQPIAFSGEKGYTLLASVQVTELNANTPITFVISKRGTVCPMTVHARFASSSSTLDPDLASFVYEGDNFGAFFCKTAESTWNLYVDNTSGWSNPCLQDWYTSQSNADRIKVTFPSEQVTELPQPWYRAIPAQVRSILDFIYPVGSIYICYSHADPASMFGGTWVRIENAFLWGCDASGTIGQTGGEKTHTLTVDELPAHTHGSVYSQHSDGTKSYPWLASGGSSLAYGTVSTGSTAAHNNMPPYIQVSIWRRTA